jgi:hypothetical protein
MGEALQAVTGDPEVLECARVATRAMVDSGDKEILAALARGHVAYAEGAALFKRLAIEKAEPKFDQARIGFARAGSLMELWALTGLAGVSFTDPIIPRRQQRSVRWPDLPAKLASRHSLVERNGV